MTQATTSLEKYVSLNYDPLSGEIREVVKEAMKYRDIVIAITERYKGIECRVIQQSGIGNCLQVHLTKRETDANLEEAVSGFIDRAGIPKSVEIDNLWVTSITDVLKRKGYELNLFKPINWHQVAVRKIGE
jgi:hypothetical protein